jgi:hypothetical protein
MRFRRTFSALLGVLGTLLIGITVTLFLVFPRVVNHIADLLGNMGVASDGSAIPVDIRQGLIHVLIALLIDIFLLYFFIWRPTKALRESYQITGLVVRKGEGQAFIDTESVRQRVLNALAKIADIQHADVIVTNDEGRAIIKLNIITDLAVNGPQKKNEINREVRKIVKDQLGIDVSGKPTINFTLAPEQPPVPLIPAGIPPRETLPVETPPPAPVIIPEPVVVSPPPVVTTVTESEPPPTELSWNETPRIQPLPYHEDTILVPEPMVHDEPEDDEPQEVVSEIPPADTLPESDNDDDQPVDVA